MFLTKESPLDEGFFSFSLSVWLSNPVEDCKLVDKQPKLLDSAQKFLDSSPKLVDSWVFFVGLRLTRLLLRRSSALKTNELKLGDRQAP
ncbi:hypothetical protein [Fictibacillus arsenicus]|uniref:Uncharacterized protein n=1 Tax=Fictibacillus arsenicus TaxID=255247 RepID=A0A1V3GD65_9BACL|nr:hypothetical protein [Fictibacillus arsenicus]OOE14728.1 hypothetical protein UN64_05945 [Fictibacillus arsenicus]